MHVSKTMMITVPSIEPIMAITIAITLIMTIIAILKSNVVRKLHHKVSSRVS